MLIARYLGRPELGLVNGLTYRLKSNVKDNYIYISVNNNWITYESLETLFRNWQIITTIK